MSTIASRASPWVEERHVKPTIVNRLLVLGPHLTGRPLHRLIRRCVRCQCYLLVCDLCSEESTRKTDMKPGFVSHLKAKPCNHHHLVFTDSACRNNGRPNAISGLGAALSPCVTKLQKSIPVTSDIDRGAKRSSQRAELLAAIEGVRTLALYDEEHGVKLPSDRRKHARIVVTDSEYVVKGMTEWFPRWRVCNS